MIPPLHCLLAGEGFFDAVCILVMDNCLDLFRLFPHFYLSCVALSTGTDDSKSVI